MHRGYTKRWRKRWDKDYCKDHLLFIMMEYFIDHANYKDDAAFLPNIGLIPLKRGQHIFSSLRIAEKLGVSRQRVRTKLKLLKLIGFLTIESTNRYSVATIINYNKYQPSEFEINQQTNLSLTSIQPAANQQLTTHNKDKKDNKDKNKESRTPPAPTSFPEILIEYGKDLNKEKNRHFENHVGEFFESIKEQCEILESKDGFKKSKFNPYQWVQVQVNKKAHPQAIDEALKGLNRYWDTTDNPWGYIEKIYKTLKQKFNEAEAIAYHEAMKKQSAELARILGVNLFKEV